MDAFVMYIILLSNVPNKSKSPQMP